MKILNSMNLKNVLILFLLISFGCSDAIEDDMSRAHLISSTRDFEPIGCVGPIGTFGFVVEYEDGISREERNDIRASFPPGYLYCYQEDYCPTNQNIEFWLLVLCPIGYMCKPLASTPNLPQLKTVFADCTN